MGMEWIEADSKWAWICKNCKSKNPLKCVQGKDYESCSECSQIVDTSPRDAAGNKIMLSNEMLGKYSYTIDAPITSKRQLSEHLHKHNLVQKLT